MHEKFSYRSAERADLQGNKFPVCCHLVETEQKDRIESGLSCPGWDQEDEVCDILALSRSLTTNLRQHSDTSFFPFICNHLLGSLTKVTRRKRRKKLIQTQSRISTEVDEFLYPVLWATWLSFSFICVNKTHSYSNNRSSLTSPFHFGRNINKTDTISILYNFKTIYASEREERGNWKCR